MDVLTLAQQHIGYLFLIFVRISGIFTAAPFFGSKNIPIYLKAGLSVILALLLLPTAVNKATPVPTAFLQYVFIVISEFLVGLIFGFAASLLFSGIQMAGQLLDMQIGFGIVNIFDAQSGQQIPLVGNFKYILGLMVFLSTNSHHILLSALFDTFNVVPLAQAVFNTSLAGIMVDMTGKIIEIAVKLSIPVLAALILTDVAMGILSKTMPQMNIFVVGVPGKLIIGILVMSFAIPFYIFMLEVGFNAMFRDIYHLLDNMH